MMERFKESLIRWLGLDALQRQLAQASLQQDKAETHLAQMAKQHSADKGELQAQVAALNAALASAGANLLASVTALKQEAATVAAELKAELQALRRIESVGEAGFCNSCKLQVPNLGELDVAKACPRCGDNMRHAAKDAAWR